MEYFFFRSFLLRQLKSRRIPLKFHNVSVRQFYLIRNKIAEEALQVPVLSLCAEGLRAWSQTRDRALKGT